MPLGSSQLCALHGIFHLIWRTPKESNLQPADLEAAALPIELEILYLVDALGIEPSESTTNALQALPAPYGITHPWSHIRESNPCCQDENLVS